MRAKSLICLMFGLTACGGGGTEPKGLTGTYDLRTINDVPLTATLQTGVACGAMVSEGTLVFQSPTTGATTRSVDYFSCDSAHDPNEVHSFTYRQSGALVVFTYPSYADTGTLSGNDITIVTHESFGTNLRNSFRYTKRP